VDWNSIARAVQEAFRTAVNEWIGKARIQGGRVQGASAVLTPGSLVSETNVELRMNQALVASKVPNGIAGALAKVLGGAWHEWAVGFQIQLPMAYPTFVAVPGPFAPPTPAAGAPSLSQGSSPGESSLKAQVLLNRLTSALRPHLKAAGGSPDNALKTLAHWVDGSFSEWKSTVRLTGLIGKGPVPTFAPPYVPVGPVLAGDNMSTGPLFAGPRFGKIVP